MTSGSWENVSLIPPKSTKSELLIREAAPLFPGVMLFPQASWANFSSMGAGLAPFFCAVVSSPEDAAAFVSIARKLDCSLVPLGGGTNIIGSDVSPADGTVFLKIAARPPVLCGDGVCDVSAGASLGEFLRTARKNGFGGAAGLSGIPGTVGGALFMNAGANGLSISDFLLDLTLLNLCDGTLRTVSRSSFPWRYRDSGIPASELIVSARFRLPPVQDSSSEDEAWEKERLRRSEYPKGRSSGSIFRNPSPSLPAGLLLERAGLKGRFCGDFYVSELHSNWIVRDPSPVPASAADCLTLLADMQRRVFLSSRIILKPEVKLIQMNDLPDNGIRPLNILVLKGGVSSERDISLQSAANVAQALREAGHRVSEYDITSLEITPEMRAADVVYPVLHGGFGEDGRIQALLEQARIPFVGGGSRSCRIAMDKIESKKYMAQAGIPFPAFAEITDADAPVPAHLHFPLIVKPNSEGSTYGLSLVRTPDEWRKALSFALKYDHTVLVEEFIEGKEATCAVFLGKALPPIEICYPGSLYDFDAKYTHAQGETEYLCPPRSIDPAVQQVIQDYSVRFAEAIGNTDMIRMDVMIRNSDGKVFMLEGNSLPGFTASSLFPKAAKVAGYTCPQVCSMLAIAACNRPR